MVLCFCLCAPQVKVPVKFNGNSGIQMRTPSNLADLAAYNSLKFYITLPESKNKRQDESTRHFVLYLGNKNVSFSIVCVSLYDSKIC